MQEKELNRATIRVVSSIDISGRAAADEIKVDLQTEEKRFFWRIASSAILRYFMAVGLLVALLAPLPASADDDKDSNHRHEDNDKGIRAEIAALKAQVTALQDQVKSLQSSNATLQEQLAAVQSNHALLLGPFVNVDPNPEIGVIGPNIVFSGANIHIVSGSGATNDNFSATGLGNLIIGYNEDPQFYFDESPGDDLPLSPLNPGDRGGSHNLVIGAANRFTRATFGGVVVGTANTIDGYGASVSGGAGNTARFYGASVSAGFLNFAADDCASVSGGRFNFAGSPFSNVSGGQGNTTARSSGNFGFGASVCGGEGNRASGTNASVCGGEGNNAIDNDSTVTGGSGTTAGSLVTFFAGIGSSVLGGSGNNAGGRNSVVIGGQNVIDNNDNSIAPKPPFP
jgi:trimeric autotransporter adhesin